MDPTDLGPGTATWLGGSGIVVTGALLWVRRLSLRSSTLTVVSFSIAGIPWM